MSVGKRDYLSRLPIPSVFLISNCRAVRKLAILAFWYWGEIVKNSSVFNLRLSFVTFSWKVVLRRYFYSYNNFRKLPLPKNQYNFDRHLALLAVHSIFSYLVYLSAPTYYYRPQIKFAKVMFSQVFFCPGGGWSASRRGSASGGGLGRPPGLLRHTIKEQAVRILLECFLVL